MNRVPHRFLALVAVALPLIAFADDSWDTVATGAITIKARNKPGTGIREIWAEGDMAASVLDIQSAILDADAYTKFMPYVKECRTIGKPEADGSKYVYTRLDLPMLTSRDYVVKVTTPQSATADGGTFENRWVAEPDHIPARSNIVRLRVNEGSWLVTPKEDGTAHVVYRFTVDPGGLIPSFAANMGNKSGVSDTFKAVETEARRRASLRGAASR